MNKLTKRFRPVLGLVACTLLACVVWAQSTGAVVAEPSAADVQIYIEGHHGKLVAAGDSDEDAYRAAVDSALEFFWKKPELVAAALLSLDYAPNQIALMFVELGVSAPSTATAVIAAAGAVASESVKAVLLLNAPAEDAVAIEAAVATVIVKLSTPPPTATETAVAQTTTEVANTAEVLPNEAVTDVPVQAAEAAPPAETPPQAFIAEPRPVAPLAPPSAPSSGGQGTTRA